MGDASLPLAQTILQRDDTDRGEELLEAGLREVNILVTGFGAFKSFTNNPSYLVASDLSRCLDPKSLSVSAALKQLNKTDQLPLCNPDTRPYQIKVHVHPTPIRVAYDEVCETIPQLISDHKKLEPSSNPAPSSAESSAPQHDYDYVFHIGMAAGRDNYTLETVAHRDHYKLKDVDEEDGSRSEAHWRAMQLPEVLDAGWNKEQVLNRWEALTKQREDEHEQSEMTKAGWKEGAFTLVETARLRSRVFLGKGKRATVKLSRDAGRYLCEFIYYTSLSTRWREARDKKRQHNQGVGVESSKVGKVAFLHVPGGTMPHDIARGVRVAESAILAFVSSWEDGYRNPDVYGDGQHVDKDVTASTAMYEMKGTGDR